MGVRSRKGRGFSTCTSSTSKATSSKDTTTVRRGTWHRRAWSSTNNSASNKGSGWIDEVGSLVECTVGSIGIEILRFVVENQKQIWIVDGGRIRSSSEDCCWNHGHDAVHSTTNLQRTKTQTITKDDGKAPFYFLSLDRTSDHFASTKLSLKTFTGC